MKMTKLLLSLIKGDSKRNSNGSIVKKKIQYEDYHPAYKRTKLTSVTNVGN